VTTHLHVTTVDDKRTFRAAAAKVGRPIRVVRFATAEPVRKGSAVTMAPVVVLQYFFAEGDRQWVYKEVIPADANGRAPLDGTLWHDLDKEGQGYELMQRSGSF